MNNWLDAWLKGWMNIWIVGWMHRGVDRWMFSWMTTNSNKSCSDEYFSNISLFLVRFKILILCNINTFTLSLSYTDTIAHHLKNIPKTGTNTQEILLKLNFIINNKKDQKIYIFCFTKKNTKLHTC